MRNPILVGWSGGKDSVLALHELLKENNYQAILLTTVTKEYSRISMHGVREVLLDAQADSLGLPIEKVYIPKTCSMEEYGNLMKRALDTYLNQGIRSMAFGDIHLQEVREYREKNLESVGMEGIFPLWGRTSAGLAHSFISHGFKAITTCVDTEMIDTSHVGRFYNEDFLKSLPENADPCGENGEFHTFVFDGPLFKEPIRFDVGENVLRDNRFYYCDLTWPRS